MQSISVQWRFWKVLVPQINVWNETKQEIFQLVFPHFQQLVAINFRDILILEFSWGVYFRNFLFLSHKKKVLDFRDIFLQLLCLPLTRAKFEGNYLPYRPELEISLKEELLGGVFLQILWNFSKQIFYGIPVDGFFRQRQI